MKRKRLFISLTVILSFFIALSIFLGVWFLADRYEDFEKNFSKEFALPWLKDGAVPQGMGNCCLSYALKDSDGETLSEKQQYFFITAYMTDGSPSRIYVTGGDTGYIGYVTAKNLDGSDYKGHCGGIAANNNGTAVWITGENNVYVLKSESGGKIAEEIVKKANGEIKDGDGVCDRTVKFTASFNANCHADFCYYYDNPNYSSLSYDKLYVGEFYRKGNYDTDKNHRITTANGYKNYAFMYEYSVSDSTSEKYGLTVIGDSSVGENDRVPRIDCIYSVPEKVQGMAVAGNYIILSQSYALANSRIKIFDKTKAADGKSTFENFEYIGVKKTSGAKYYADLTLYVLDCNDREMLKTDYSIPSMSEGLCTVSTAGSAKAYVLFESAGKKYRLFVRERLSDVYSFKIKT